MRSIYFTFLFLVVFSLGCASGNPADPNAAAAPHAQCTVCKYNADLACIDIVVDPSTPTATYNDKTYYFCSRECRDEFNKHPAKYVAR